MLEAIDAAGSVEMHSMAMNDGVMKNAHAR